jgi:hypothetical protein
MVAAVTRLSDDQSVREEVVLSLVRDIAQRGYTLAPPQLAQRAYRVLKRETGIDDPLWEEKKTMNENGLAILPTMRSTVDAQPDPMEAAVKLAVYGNIMDMGIHGHDYNKPLEQSLDEALSGVLWGADISEFNKCVARAESILYLCDNAGEIVFDKLLMERLPLERITAVVRGYPVINDATMEDAVQVGLKEMVPVIGNGSDAPGSIVDECSREFQDLFDKADLIISKGQGNYETLSGKGKRVAYLLTAKCSVVAGALGCPMGAGILYIKD